MIETRRFFYFIHRLCWRIKRISYLDENSPLLGGHRMEWRMGKDSKSDINDTALAALSNLCLARLTPTWRHSFAKAATVSVAVEKVGGLFSHPMDKTSRNAINHSSPLAVRNTTPNCSMNVQIDTVTSIRNVNPSLMPTLSICAGLRICQQYLP